MTTPAERRRRVARRRQAGWALVAVGVVTAAVGIVALFLEVNISYVDAPGGAVCGGVIDQFLEPGKGGDVCREALSGYVIAVIASASAAVVSLGAGIFVLVRNPA